MKDRFKLNQFLQGQKTGTEYFLAQEITDDVLIATKLSISLLPIDFPNLTTLKYRKELESKWIQLLPKLDNVTSLSLRHKADQVFFEAICKMKNLKHLHLWASTFKNISNIKKLQNLESMSLDSCTKLEDIKPLLTLKKLNLLSIENCFKIYNYEIIGNMPLLKGLRISGNTFAPKNLRLKSLKPFAKLTKLKHLDLTSTSVVDNSYEVLLNIKSLERFDTTIIINKSIREKIKADHKKLKAGFFIDYDFDNKKFYDGKEW